MEIWSVLYLVFGLLASATLFNMVWRAREIYHVCRQLDGPKFVFPGGNLKELNTYEHAGEAFRSWSLKYGTTYRVWLGPFRVIVVTSDTAYIKQMLVSDKDRWDIGKRPALKLATGNSLLTSKNPLWQHQRQLMNPAFHFHNLREMTPVFDKYVVKFLDRCEQLAASGEAADIGHMLQSLTMDIIGSSAFGAELRAQDPLNPSPLLGYISRILGGPGVFSSILVQLLPQKMLPTYWKRKQAVDQVRAHMSKIVKQRINEVESKAEEECPRDLLGLLVGCKDEKTGARMPLGQIMDESMAFLLAGHETTSTLMTWLLYALALHPDVDTKLFDELSAHSEQIKDRAPTHEDIRQLTYLMQTVEETLRAYDPVPAIGRRALHQDNYLGKLLVPRDVFVVINMYGLHHDGTHWPEPSQFKPERFVKPSTISQADGTNSPSTSPTNESTSPTSPASTSPTATAATATTATKRDKYSWMPFSYGPRHCIGQEFALLEARSLLSQILVRYRFALVSDQTPVKKHVSVVMRPKKPIMMTVHRR